jgi:hypothetical protein
VELFCQTIYQNGSNSTDGAIHGAKALENGFTSEVELCQTMAMFFILLSYELGFQRGFSVTAIRDATELWWNVVPYLGSAAASC